MHITFVLLFTCWLCILSCLPVAAQDITSNLAAWWKFNENTGTSAADSSGNSNTGTLSGATLPAWTASCQVDTCLSFNGTTAYVTVPTSASLNITTGDFTLAAWVFPTAVDSANHMIAQRGNSAIDVPNYQLVLSSANLFRFLYEFAGGPGVVTVNSATTPTASQWYHVVGTASRAGVSSVYVNGVLENTTAGNATSLSNATVFSIGAQQSNASFVNFFTGTIDEVRLYSRELTAGDVAALYAYGLSTAPKRRGRVW